MAATITTIVVKLTGEDVAATLISRFNMPRDSIVQYEVDPQTGVIASATITHETAAKHEEPPLRRIGPAKDF